MKINTTASLMVIILALSSPLVFAEQKSVPQDNSAAINSEIEGDLELGQELGPYGRQLPEGSLIDSEMFGRGGYFHPFLSVAGVYSDNVFNDSADEVSDYLMVLSPGIWLAYPPNRTPLLSLETFNSMPGGLTIDRDHSNYFRRYQTYFLYQGDFTYFSDNTDANTREHLLQGMLQYNLKGGLSFDFVDEYKKSQDPYSLNVSGRQDIDRYETNLFDTIVSYDLSRYFKVRGSYSYYWVDYDEQYNVGRNRNDDTYSAYLYFKFKPKTTFYGQYKYVDIEYDEQIVSSSSNDYWYGGLIWEPTAKTTVDLKLGYVQKDFDMVGIDNVDDFVFETKGKIDFSEKSSIELQAGQRIRETTTSDYDYIHSNKISLLYLRKPSTKLTATVLLSYGEDEYKNLRIGSTIVDREDDILKIAPGIDYQMKDWLVGSFFYTRTERDSNFDEQDYTSNTFVLRLTANF